MIAAIIEEEGRLEKRLKDEREDNEDLLKAMDHELVRLDRKEILHEKALLE